MWKKVKAWIIHKFGGKTQEEYNIDIKNFKAEYDMTHPTKVRYINRYPQKEIFKYEFVVPDELVYDTDEFMASEEFRKIREDIIFEIATTLLDGDYVQFETYRDLEFRTKKIKAILCVLK
jgi:hypothetical protein